METQRSEAVVSVPRLISFSEAAEILGVAKSTLYAWTSQNRVPHIKLSKRLIKFRMEELLSWIEQRSSLPQFEAIRRNPRLTRPCSTDSIEQVIRNAREEVLENAK